MKKILTNSLFALFLISTTNAQVSDAVLEAMKGKKEQSGGYSLFTPYSGILDLEIELDFSYGSTWASTYGGFDLFDFEADFEAVENGFAFGISALPSWELLALDMSFGISKTEVERKFDVPGESVTFTNDARVIGFSIAPGLIFAKRKGKVSYGLIYAGFSLSKGENLDSNYKYTAYGWTAGLSWKGDHGSVNNKVGFVWGGYLSLGGSISDKDSEGDKDISHWLGSQFGLGFGTVIRKSATSLMFRIGSGTSLNWNADEKFTDGGFLSINIVYTLTVSQRLAFF